MRAVIGQQDGRRRLRVISGGWTVRRRRGRERCRRCRRSCCGGPTAVALRHRTTSPSPDWTRTSVPRCRTVVPATTCDRFRAWRSRKRPIHLHRVSVDSLYLLPTEDRFCCRLNDKNKLLKRPFFQVNLSYPAPETYDWYSVFIVKLD